MLIVEQLFVGYGGDTRQSVAEGRPAAVRAQAYVIRKRIEHAADQLALTERQMFRILSPSSRTLIYSGC
jgi:hypothetical protein